jgi:hypothetical protein
MEALDGNAIAGALQEAFGAEMTIATGTCGTCGASNMVAQLTVYLQAPGIVVRCPACDSVLMVLVQAHDKTCVDTNGLASLS